MRERGFVLLLKTSVTKQATGLASAAYTVATSLTAVNPLQMNDMTTSLLSGYFLGPSHYYVPPRKA